MDSLKMETRSAHQAMHDHPIIRTLCTPNVDLKTYHNVLQAYHSVYSKLETFLIDGLQQTALAFDYTPRRKLPWLQQDLTFFNLPEIATVIEKTAIQLNPHKVSDLIGALYVIEGSTLGGQVIAKQLQTNLHISKSSGGRFFAGYEEQTTKMWENFRHFALTCAEVSEEEVIAAAKWTFTYFHKQLDAYNPNLQ